MIHQFTVTRSTTDHRLDRDTAYPNTADSKNNNEQAAAYAFESCQREALNAASSVYARQTPMAPLLSVSQSSLHSTTSFMSCSSRSQARSVHWRDEQENSRWDAIPESPTSHKNRSPGGKTTLVLDQFLVTPRRRSSVDSEQVAAFMAHASLALVGVFDQDDEEENTTMLEDM